MITVIQRVVHATVTIDNKIKSQIGPGLLILVGVGHEDSDEDIAWLTSKIVNLRIFDDNTGVMNVNAKNKGADIMVVSQFTLQAGTKKGNRPSYSKAAPPSIAIPLYQQFVAALEAALEKPICTGEFGADMKVGLINDGPVTIVIDTKNKV